MAQTTVSSLNDTVQKTQVWLKELAEIGRFEDESQAYSAFRGVLHALRDRLTVDEAAHVASGLPMLVRGFYYEGWKPAATPQKYSTANEFRDRVKEKMGNGSPVDPNHATRTVFELLERKLPAGEIENVRQMLPGEIRALWPSVETVQN